MSNYKTELESAITSANDLICTMTAIGDAMATGENAAADYVGAIRVLAQAAEFHAHDLKAIRLCQTWEADGVKTLLNDLTDYLTDAMAYRERVESMLGVLCEEYFNLNQNMPGGKEDIVLFFDENRVFAEIARSCLLDLSKVISDMKGYLAIVRDEVKSA